MGAGVCTHDPALERAWLNSIKGALPVMSTRNLRSSNMWSYGKTLRFKKNT